jgi:hypothetical protein
VVNKRMKAEALLRLARKVARAEGYSIEELPGRGKGSHRIYAVLDSAGNELGRFSLTHHPKDVSWTVLRQIEDNLAHLFGENWMERR